MTVRLLLTNILVLPLDITWGQDDVVISINWNSDLRMVKLGHGETRTELRMVYQDVVLPSTRNLRS